MLFLLLCCYIALYYIRPFEWVEQLRGIPIFTSLGILSILSLVVAWANSKITLFRFKTDGMMLGFIAAIILSHLRHGWFGGALTSSIEFLPSFVCYFLSAHAIDSEKKLKWFLVLLISLSIFLTYESYLQVSRGFSHGGLEPLIQYGETGPDGSPNMILRVRWFGPFNDPNDLGLALAFVVPFLVNRIFEKRYLLPGLCLPVVLFGIYLTNSRGTMLSVVISLFTYSVIRYRSTKGIVLGAILVSLLFVFGPSRMGEISGSDESSYGRLEAWYAGFQMFKSYPLFGVGKGMFTEYHFLTAHNSYMLVLAELGMFGSFFFLGIFFYPVFWAKRNLMLKAVSDGAQQKRCLLAAAFGSLAGLMAAMFFLSRSYTLLPFMCLGFLMAAIDILQAAENNGEQARVAGQFHLIWVFGLLAAQIIGINLMIKILL